MSEEKMKVLFLATGSGNDHDRQRLAEEARAITRKIRLGSHGDRIEFISEWAVRIDDLQEALLRHNPSVVHFSGLGLPGGLLFENAKGETRQVPKSALCGLFRILNENVAVVVLNACYTQ